MTTSAPKWKDAYEAAEHSDLEAVKYFVETGEDVFGSTNDEGRSVALIAAHRNDSSILKYALERDGSLLLESDYSGNNIIQYAIDNNALDMVKYLVEHHKWDVHYRNRPSLGNTPIHHAAKIGKLGILKYFIEEKQGDVNARNDFDDPPVFLAAEQSHMRIIKYLVEEHQANLTLTNSRYENILFIAAKAGHLNVIQYVLDERETPLNINWMNKRHRTILYIAVKKRNPRLIKYLVEWKEADVNISDDEKIYPIHIAASQDNIQVCRFLIEHGANIWVKDKFGYYPKDNANNEELLQYFEEVVHERNRRSLTPLVPYMKRESSCRLTPGPFPEITGFGATKQLNNHVVESDIDNSKFVNFLTVADIIVRYAIKRTSYSASQPQGLLSPPEILEKRMDPTVFDAILTSPNE